jgi:hypothetical protein
VPTSIVSIDFSTRDGAEWTFLSTCEEHRGVTTARMLRCALPRRNPRKIATTADALKLRLTIRPQRTQSPIGVEDQVAWHAARILVYHHCGVAVDRAHFNSRRFGLPIQGKAGTKKPGTLSSAGFPLLKNGGLARSLTARTIAVQRHPFQVQLG